MQLDFISLLPALPTVVAGAATTCKVVLLGFPMGLLLGTMAAYSAEGRLPIPRRAARLYVEVVRNVPFLILVYVGFFGLPKLGVALSAFTVGVTMIALATGGYFSEILRAGFHSVPRGQSAAAESLGMSHAQCQRLVVLPQLLPFIVPATTNLAIQMLKESAVLSVIGLSELTYQSQLLTAETFAYVEVFGVTALAYWLASLALEAGSKLLERSVTSWKRG